MKKYSMSQFSDALQKMASNVRGDVLKRAALAGGYTIEAHAKINVEKTFKPGTGNLAGSIQTTVEKADADSVTVAVGPTVIYGRIQEFGGIIKPVFAKMLHWVGEDGAHHQANAVTIPARPYLRPAVDENVEKIMRAIGENLRIEIEGQI